MENTNPNSNENLINQKTDNFKYSTQFSAPLPPVPNATTGLVLGIIGLVFSIIWCYWFGSGIGLILSIISLVLSNNAIKAFNQKPTAYSEASLANARAGKTLGIIGIIISILWLLLIIIFLVFIGSLASFF
jgi:hypothetical protein